MLNFKNILKTVQSRSIAGNKPFHIIIFLLLFCCEAKTQTNLVYNGDFEIFDTCPNITSQPYTNQIKYCLGWDKPTDATSDYFNACDNSTFSHQVGVPTNGLGFQHAKSGNAYCGFAAYSPDTNINRKYREYIIGKLTQELEIKKRYKLSFYVSYAEISNWAVSEIGAHLSTYLINIPNYTDALFLQPQIKNQFGNFLMDTLNWMKISGEFTANGGEKYITIGWFGSNSNDTLSYNIYNLSSLASYYYIDDVELYEVPCNQNLPNIFTPNNDGVNDTLHFTLCDEIMKTTIYNRWGNIVFQTDKVNHYWDARTTSGILCEDGTYFYVLETKEKNHKGFVQLVR